MKCPIAAVVLSLQCLAGVELSGRVAADPSQVTSSGAPILGAVSDLHPAMGPSATKLTAGPALDVPILKQEPERCGEAALGMVLRYYGAVPAALREVDGAYDPVLHGSLITDLAGAARRAGYTAIIATLTPDSLIGLLKDDVPPILLYQNGRGPLTVRHFGVVAGWDATRGAFILHDGGGRPRMMRRGDLVKRWETAGSQALIVRRRLP
jgi:hypothetical protein